MLGLKASLIKYTFTHFVRSLGIYRSLKLLRYRSVDAHSYSFTTFTHRSFGLKASVAYRVYRS